ncbi:MAG: YggT family protein [Candidatus Aminicenantales bacterium]
MILFGNTLAFLARVLHIGLNIYLWIIILGAVFSWIYVPSLYQIVRVLYRLTEPVLRPVRRFVPPARFGGLDVSPIIVCILIVFVDNVLVNSLARYAFRLLRGTEISF